MFQDTGDAEPGTVRAKLDEGAPYVVRFRAPDTNNGQRVRFTDAIRGVARETGELLTDLFEMREAANKAKADHED